MYEYQTNNYKSKYAVKKRAKLVNNDKLQSNISGLYNYYSNRNEFKPTEFKTIPISKEKKVYSIRLGDNQNQLMFINHTDYYSEKTTYEINQFDQIEFSYNNENYTIEIKGNIAEITKSKIYNNAC